MRERLSSNVEAQRSISSWGDFDRYEKYKKSFNGLSCRAFNCFYLFGDSKYDEAEKVIEAINSGKLHPKSKGRPRNYGWRVHIEVCQFFGLPDPVTADKCKRLKILEEKVRRLKGELVA